MLRHLPRFLLALAISHLERNRRSVRDSLTDWPEPHDQHHRQHGQSRKAEHTGKARQSAVHARYRPRPTINVNARLKNRGRSDQRLLITRLETEFENASRSRFTIDFENGRAVSRAVRFWKCPLRVVAGIPRD